MLSPASPFEEGSNQSASTQDGGDVVSPSKSDDYEEIDFEKYLPVKDLALDEDFGPPIKPTGLFLSFSLFFSHESQPGIDFTKSMEWETDTFIEGKVNPTKTDERTSTLQYLLSNADLLAEALRTLDSSPSGGTDVLNESSEDVKSKAKRKRRKSNKKKKRAT